MTVSAQDLIAELSGESPKLGDIKKRGKEIKKDHDLALELWASGGFFPRMLATLIFDKKCLTQDSLNQLADDILAHNADERDQLADWLLANQLMKDKTLTSLMQGWEKHPSPILRRLFWYHQARLRWTGQTPPENSDALVASLEESMGSAEPVVQWAMNFCAGQIGIHEPAFRPRCIALGETLGLYRDERVPKNCTPNYLPEFIRIEVAKREARAG